MFDTGFPENDASASSASEAQKFIKLFKRRARNRMGREILVGFDFDRVNLVLEAHGSVH